jgi:hypothetical protein
VLAAVADVEAAAAAGAAREAIEAELIGAPRHVHLGQVAQLW